MRVLRISLSSAQLFSKQLCIGTTHLFAGSRLCSFFIFGTTVSFCLLACFLHTTKETHRSGPLSAECPTESECGEQQAVFSVDSVRAEAAGLTAGRPGGGTVGEDDAGEADGDCRKRGRGPEERAPRFLSASEYLTGKS